MPCRILYNANIRIIRITSKYLPLKNGRARKESPGKGRGRVTVIYFDKCGAAHAFVLCAEGMPEGLLRGGGEAVRVTSGCHMCCSACRKSFPVTRNVLFRSMKKPLLRRETVYSVPSERLFRIIVSAKRLTVRELLATPFSPYLRPPPSPSACRLPVRTNDCSFF